MKYLILFILSTTSLLASECDQYFKEDLFKSIVKSKTCTFETGNKSSSIYTEIVYLKDSCELMEGSKKESCYMIRVCPKVKGSAFFQSQSIFKDQVQAKDKCKLEGVDELLGSKFDEPRSPIKAHLGCDKDKVVVELSDSTKNLKKCILTFK